MMQCFDHELTEKLIPGRKPCFRWLVIPDNFNCSGAMSINVLLAAKNTLNLKIIDQIYYFRYALLQNFKGTQKNSN